MPTTAYSESELKEGKELIAVLVDTGLAKTRSDARRLIEQGGVSVNGEKAKDIKAIISEKDLSDEGVILLQKGKKAFHQVKIGDAQ